MFKRFQKGNACIINSLVGKKSTISNRDAIVPFGWVDIALLGVVIIWGTNFAVIKTSIKQIFPLAFTGLRFMIGAIMLFVIVKCTNTRLFLSRSDWWKLFRLALIGHIIFQPLFVIGLSYTSAGSAALIMAASPALVAMQTHFLKGDKLSRLAWLGVLLSFIGVALAIMSHKEATISPNMLFGDIITVCAAFCWSTYIVMVRPLVDRIPTLAVTTITLSIGAAGLLLIAIPSLISQNWSTVSLPRYMSQF